MTKIAIAVKPDLTTEVLDLTENSLRTLQSAVDGLIQPVDFDSITMWVNEEGLFRNDLDWNWLASGFMEQLGSDTLIRGTAVFTGGVDEEGDTMGMPDDAVLALMGLVARAKDALEL